MSMAHKKKEYKLGQFTAVVLSACTYLRQVGTNSAFFCCFMSISATL